MRKLNTSSSIVRKQGKCKVRYTELANIKQRQYIAAPVEDKELPDHNLGPEVRVLNKQANSFATRPLRKLAIANHSLRLARLDNYIEQVGGSSRVASMSE